METSEKRLRRSRHRYRSKATQQHSDSLLSYSNDRAVVQREITGNTPRKSGAPVPAESNNGEKEIEGNHFRLQDKVRCAQGDGEGRRVASTNLESFSTLGNAGIAPAVADGCLFLDRTAEDSLFNDDPVIPNEQELLQEDPFLDEETFLNDQQNIPSDIEEIFEDPFVEDHFVDRAEDTASEIGEGIGSYLNPLIQNWRTLWGLIMTTGSRKLTKAQYQSVRVAVNCFLQSEKNTTIGNASGHRSGATGALPHFSTLYKTVKPVLFRMLTTRSVDELVPMDIRKAGARCTSYSAGGEPLTKIRIVLPSEHARADVATPEFFQIMLETSLQSAAEKGYSTRHPTCLVEECIDLWPIVGAREWFYGKPASISVDSSNVQAKGREEFLQHFAEKEDRVQLELFEMEGFQIEESVTRAFGSRDSSAVQSYLVGNVVHVWTVHALKRKTDPLFQDDSISCLSPRDRQIVQSLNWVTYKSPNDSVEIEISDLPEEDEDERSGLEAESPGRSKRRKRSVISDARKARRAAIRERKRQIESSWAHWSKPLLKPGDTLALLRPTKTPDNGTLLTSTDRHSRLIVVCRFWVEQEERAKHVVWIPGGLDLSPDTTETTHAEFLCRSMNGHGRRLLHVKSIVLAEMHSGPRGPDKFSPVSSVGVLENGEKYCVYRFLLFWDGFEVQSGKAASGDGIYLICLNLTQEARATPNAVRVVSLTPPGVKSDVVFECIMTDIRKGMTEGVVDMDAAGSTRRIFLDLVGMLGDTPALNAALDVLGHTASRFCHLCRTVRSSSTNVGSRYTSLASHAALTAHARRFFQHQAVRDSTSEGRTCTLLGMKPCPSRSHSILHELTSAILSTKGNIPITNRGVPVLPSVLDPYRSCLVAPDHLLTGHLRDCLNLAIRLMPNGRFRSTAEAFLLAYLRQCCLPEQNRLIDMEKRALYAMSMSESYAVGVVAHAALRQACALEESRQQIPDSVKTAYTKAVDLAGSCANLIAMLLYFPKKSRDGRESVASFEEAGGRAHMATLQNEVKTHILRVEAICNLKEDDFSLIENGSRDRRELADASRRQKWAKTAISCIDRPNVHRLLELAYTTLPMVGHVSRCGELVLEKAHQALKRAIKHSNHKDIHIHAMQSAIFNDWQGRLTLAVTKPLEESTSSVLFCYRLLAGREAVTSVAGRADETIRDMVKQALGPDNCIKAELQTQNKTVLAAPKRKGDPVLNLMNPVKSIPVLMHRPVSFGSVSHAHQFIDLMHRRIQGNNIFISQGIRVSYTNHAEKLQKGDVVSALCYNPTDVSFHSPLVMTEGTFPRGTGLPYRAGPMFWCIQSFSLPPQHSDLLFIMPLYIRLLLPLAQTKEPRVCRIRFLEDRLYEKPEFVL